MRVKLEGYTYGTLDGTLDRFNGIWGDWYIVSDCGRVSIEVNPFIGQDRLETTHPDDVPVFYYD